MHVLTRFILLVFLLQLLSACGGGGNGESLVGSPPVASPTAEPGPAPTPTITPTAVPTNSPSLPPMQSTPTPTSMPSVAPSPTSSPTASPTPTATLTPTPAPTQVGNYNYEPIVTGCNGYASRFWDCCKPHCSWSGNVASGMTSLPSCSINNVPIVDINAASSCDGGDANTCFGLAPIRVSETLSFGYAATSSGDVCGRCFQLQFTGSSFNAPGDQGSAALSGKTMIVQAINIGYDVGNGQFDILIPGGGVGAFNACSKQWGVSNDELGAQYGGFLLSCKESLGWNATLSEYKACVTNRCDSVFGARGLTELHNACLWYVNWFEAADNPSLKYKEVACPDLLVAQSKMDRSFLSDISTACGN